MLEETFIDSQPKRDKIPFLWIGVGNTDEATGIADRN